MADVATSEKFTARMTEAQREALDKIGARVALGVSFEDLEGVPEIGGGESVIGELTHDEERQYILLHQLTERFEALGREMSADGLVGLSECLRQGKSPSDMADTFRGSFKEDVAVEVFRVEREREFVKSVLYYGISLRFGIYDYKLGIRTRKRIVQGERKW